MLTNMKSDKKVFSIVLLLQMILCLSLTTTTYSAVLGNSAEQESLVFLRQLTTAVKGNTATTKSNEDTKMPLQTDKTPKEVMEDLLQRFPRSVDNGRTIEIHRSSDTIDFSVPCGSCQKRRRKITIRKPGCVSVTIAVRTCRGMCESWEVPHYEPPYFMKHHPVCRPARIELVRTKLRCAPNRNPNRVIAIPRRCACSICDPSTTVCRPLY